MAKIKVTLVKSPANETKKVKATVASMGLRKINSSNTFEDDPAVRGKIHKVGYLLKVEEAEEE